MAQDPSEQNVANEQGMAVPGQAPAPATTLSVPDTGQPVVPSLDRTSSQAQSAGAGSTWFDVAAQKQAGGQTQIDAGAAQPTLPVQDMQAESMQDELKQTAGPAQVVSGTAGLGNNGGPISAGKPSTKTSDALLAELDGVSVAELQQLRAGEVAFSWQASEYVHHHKGVAWYIGLVGGMVVLAGLAALLQYWTTLVAFLAMGGAIIVYALKPPRTLLYELTPDGLTIEGRHFLFAEFRSFGVLPDADWHTIDLEPVKRFSPRITVLFNGEDFEEIVGHLELHLPRVDRQPDLIERVSRYLRF